jgi:hypothetical protein
VPQDPESFKKSPKDNEHSLRRLSRPIACPCLSALARSLYAQLPLRARPEQSQWSDLRLRVYATLI